VVIAVGVAVGFVIHDATESNAPPHTAPSPATTPLRMRGAVGALAQLSLASGTFTIRGSMSASGVSQFTGIPYADPVDRFAVSAVRSEALEGGPFLASDSLEVIKNKLSSGQASDTSYRACPSLEQPDGDSVDDANCLLLNIFVPPGTNVTSRHPVYMFIHGGSFTSGDALGYNFSHIAETQSVLVVTVQYRLAVFGFMPLDDKGSGGYNGIHDCITALAWIQAHIGRFGGDSSAVTIGGQGAGGRAASIIAVSPAAKGLFRYAIAQSLSEGSCGDGLASCSAAQGDAVRKLLLHSLGANMTGLTDRSLFSNSLLNEAYNVVSRNYLVLTVYGPGNNVIQKHPFDLYGAGDIVAERMLYGVTSYDGTLDTLLSWGEQLPADNEEITDELQLGPPIGGALTAPQASAVLKYYSTSIFGSGSEGALAAYYAANSDFYFGCPTFRYLSNASTSGKVAYRYTFAAMSESDAMHAYLQQIPSYARHIWASRDSMMPFVTGEPSFLSSNTAANQALAQQIQDYWFSFVRTGIPSSAAGPSWPPYTEDGDQPTMQLEASAPFIVRNSDMTPMQRPRGIGPSVQCADLWNPMTFQTKLLPVPWPQQ